MAFQCSWALAGKVVAWADGVLESRGQAVGVVNVVIHKVFYGVKIRAVTDKESLILFGKYYGFTQISKMSFRNSVQVFYYYIREQLIKRYQTYSVLFYPEKKNGIDSI